LRIHRRTLYDLRAPCKMVCAIGNTSHTGSSAVRGNGLFFSGGMEFLKC
jgi:hypothetical protein